ncbi:MAG: DEAD/DEAH box helicase, partial [Bacteroidetes bacterium]
FIDRFNQGLISEEGVLNFFFDDLIVKDEASAGAVSMIKFYDYVKSPEAVKRDFLALEKIKKVAYFPGKSGSNLKTKMNLLLQLLQDETRFNRVLIFARTRTIANNIFKYLTRKFAEETIRVIHANKAQNARINAMEAFKAGEVRIMVATDVVSRGIDVSLVSHVINFDVPLIYEDYVHRIGRTGRALQTGEAITFVTIAEKYHVGKIEGIIRQTIPIADLPADLDITETPFVESQAMLREIDDQRKIADPTFKGAFHEKKSVPTKKKRKPRPKVDPRSRAWKLKRKR